MKVPEVTRHYLHFLQRIQMIPLVLPSTLALAILPTTMIGIPMEAKGNPSRPKSDKHGPVKPPRSWLQRMLLVLQILLALTHLISWLAFGASRPVEKVCPVHQQPIIQLLVFKR
jgi:hypothetical protein